MSKPDLIDVVKQPKSITGIMIKDGVKIVSIIRYQNRWYKLDGPNAEVVDTYLHTGNVAHLRSLENGTDSPNEAIGEPSDGKTTTK